MPLAFAKVVEQAIGRLPARADRSQSGQLLGGITMARTRDAVQAEVADLADGNRFGFEGIEHRDQIEFLKIVDTFIFFIFK